MIPELSYEQETENEIRAVLKSFLGEKNIPTIHSKIYSLLFQMICGSFELVFECFSSEQKSASIYKIKLTMNNEGKEVKIIEPDIAGTYFKEFDSELPTSKLVGFLLQRRATQRH